jgi:IQ calmodulin-binding motif
MLGPGTASDRLVTTQGPAPYDLVGDVRRISELLAAASPEQVVRVLLKLRDLLDSADEREREARRRDVEGEDFDRRDLRLVRKVCRAAWTASLPQAIARTLDSADFSGENTEFTASMRTTLATETLTAQLRRADWTAAARLAVLLVDVCEGCDGAFDVAAGETSKRKQVPMEEALLALAPAPALSMLRLAQTCDDAQPLARMSLVRAVNDLVECAPGFGARMLRSTAERSVVSAVLVAAAEAYAPGDDGRLARIPSKVVSFSAEIATLVGKLAESHVSGESDVRALLPKSSVRAALTLLQGSASSPRETAANTRIVQALVVALQCCLRCSPRYSAALGKSSQALDSVCAACSADVLPAEVRLHALALARQLKVPEIRLRDAALALEQAPRRAGELDTLRAASDSDPGQQRRGRRTERPASKRTIGDREAATIIQSVFRGFQARRGLARQEEAAFRIQAWFRSAMAKQFRRRNLAVAQRQQELQRENEMHEERLVHHRKRLATIARLPAGDVDTYLELERNNAAVRIQAIWRGFSQQRRFAEHLDTVRRHRAAVVLQRHFRATWAAKQVAKGLVAERDLGVQRLGHKKVARSQRQIIERVLADRETRARAPLRDLQMQSAGLLQEFQRSVVASSVAARERQMLRARIDRNLAELGALSRLPTTVGGSDDEEDVAASAEALRSTLLPGVGHPDALTAHENKLTELAVPWWKRPDDDCPTL